MARTRQWQIKPLFQRESVWCFFTKEKSMTDLIQQEQSADVPWATFVKQYSSQHGLTYGQGLSQAGPAWRAYKVSTGNPVKPRPPPKKKEPIADTNQPINGSTGATEVKAPKKRKPRVKKETPEEARLTHTQSAYDLDDEIIEETTTVVKKRKRADVPHKTVALEKKKVKKAPAAALPLVVTEQVGGFITNFPPEPPASAPSPPPEDEGNMMSDSTWNGA